MRIGILTIPPSINYGGIIQACALQTLLTDMGHEVYLITPKRTPLYFKLAPLTAPLVYLKRLYRKYIKGEKNLVIFYTQRLQLEHNTIALYTHEYIDKHIHKYNCENFNEIDPNFFDAIVVGSDQIWRGRFHVNILNSYLDFAKSWNIKRIAYAASFGIATMEEYEDNEIVECGELLKLFDAVSVREDSGVELCKDYFGVEAQHLLDPTMLLESSHYTSLCEAEQQHSNILFSYFLDKTPEKETTEKQVAKHCGLNTYCFRQMEYKRGIKDIDKYILPSPSKWIAAFRDAEFIVTDSFHGTVFSIIFNKPFIAIINQRRWATRFTSLLKIFGLEDRLITECRELEEKHFAAIEWNQINKIKREWQQKSFDFLKQL